MSASKVLIILGERRWTARIGYWNRDPERDRHKLLDFLIRRLSIPRDCWIKNYCFEGWKKQISTRKKDRQDFLAPQIARLVQLVQESSPCVLVGMGKLSCECLEGSSILKRRASTDWRARAEFVKVGKERVWITHSPESALFNPNLVVNMSRVLGKAAIGAGIDVKMDYSLPLFDWSPYM